MTIIIANVCVPKPNHPKPQPITEAHLAEQPAAIRDLPSPACHWHPLQPPTAVHTVAAGPTSTINPVLPPCGKSLPPCSTGHACPSCTQSPLAFGNPPLATQCCCASPPQPPSQRLHPPCRTCSPLRAWRGVRSVPTATLSLRALMTARPRTSRVPPRPLGAPTTRRARRAACRSAAYVDAPGAWRQPCEPTKKKGRSKTHVVITCQLTDLSNA